MSLLSELKRRNVIRVGTAYIVVSWLLVQVVETVFPAFGFEDAAIRVTVIVAAIGFIPALVFAWVFELTPDGIKKETEIDRNQPVAPGAGKKLDRAIMVVLALAVVFFAADKFLIDPARDAQVLDEVRQEAMEAAQDENLPEASIAVLPFADMSQNGDQQYLSDGLSEELLNLLAQIPELRVASRSSAFNLRDARLSVPEMASRLMVAHILEGSVRMAGEKLRVTVQLIEAATDSHLWSQTYDRTFDDVFAIQDDIAAQVVHELQIELLGTTPRAPDVDPRAYQLYLKAGHMMRRYQADESPEVTRLLEEAVGIDPSFAGAWLRLGGNYQRQATYRTIPREEGLAKAWAAYDIAERLEPDSASLQQKKAWMAMRWEKDIPKAVRYTQKAVDLSEKPMQKVGAAYDTMRFLAMFEWQALYCRWQAEKDPTDASAYKCMAGAYLNMGECGQAYQHTHTALTINPGMWNAHDMVVDSLACQGRWEEVLVEAEKIGDNEELRWIYLAIAYSKTGQADKAEPLLSKMREAGGGSWVDLAWYYWEQGDLDTAFEMMDRWGEQPQNAWNIARNAVFDPLRSDPRWAAFAERMGATEEQLSAYQLVLPMPPELRAMDPHCELVPQQENDVCE